MVLSGWKEIANHLRCGVRTAQRWENLGTGLPIRRHRGGGVCALPEELDQWLKNAASTQGNGNQKLEVLVAETDPLVLKCSACLHHFDTSSGEKLVQDIVAHVQSHPASTSMDVVPAAQGYHAH